MRGSFLRLFVILLALICGTLIQQPISTANSNQYVLPLQLISTETTGTATYPGVATDGQGNIHVVWQDSTNYAGAGTDQDIFYKLWNATTHTWTTSQVVSTDSTGNSLYPSVATDSQGNVHVVWEDNTNYASAGTDWDVFYKLWNASTQMWGTTQVVSTDSTGSSYNPRIATDDQRNLHITWRDQTNYNSSGSDWDIFYKMWNVSAQTWESTQVVSTESTGNSQNPSIATDAQMNVHVVWEDNTNYTNSGMDYDIFYKSWIATSKTWTTTQVVSNESTSNSQHPSITTDSQGNVHIVWEDLTDYLSSGIDNDIFYKVWNATNLAWSAMQVVSTESTSDSSYPCITTDSQMNAHVAWQDATNYDNSGVDIDIFSKSQNATDLTWSITQVVSVESTANSGYPSISTDISDDTQILWHDSTDILGAGTGNDIFMYEAINLITATQTTTSTTTDITITTTTDTVTDTTIATTTDTITQNVTQAKTISKTNSDIETVTSVVTSDHTLPGQTITDRTTKTTSAPFFVLPIIFTYFVITIIGKQIYMKRDEYDS